MKPLEDVLRVALTAGLTVLLAVLPLLSLEVPLGVAPDELPEAPPDIPPDVLPVALLPVAVLPVAVLPVALLPGVLLPLALAAGLVVLLDVLPLLSLELPAAGFPIELPARLPDGLVVVPLVWAIAVTAKVEAVSKAAILATCLKEPGRPDAIKNLFFTLILWWFV